MQGPRSSMHERSLVTMKAETRRVICTFLVYCVALPNINNFWALKFQKFINCSTGFAKSPLRRDVYIVAFVVSESSTRIPIKPVP